MSEILHQYVNLVELKSTKLKYKNRGVFDDLFDNYAHRLFKRAIDGVLMSYGLMKLDLYEFDSFGVKIAVENTPREWIDLFTYTQHSVHGFYNYDAMLLGVLNCANGFRAATTTFFHELTHHRQHVTSNKRITLEDEGHLQYHERPSEKEAYAMQETLINSLIEDYNLRKFSPRQMKLIDQASEYM